MTKLVRQSAPIKYFIGLTPAFKEKETLKYFGHPSTNEGFHPEKSIKSTCLTNQQIKIINEITTILTKHAENVVGT